MCSSIFEEVQSEKGEVRSLERANPVTPWIMNKLASPLSNAEIRYFLKVPSILPQLAFIAQDSSNSADIRKNAIVSITEISKLWRPVGFQAAALLKELAKTDQNSFFQSLRKRFGNPKEKTSQVLRRRSKQEEYTAGVVDGEEDLEFDSLPADSALRQHTVDWQARGHRGTFYHLIKKSFRDWAPIHDGPAGIFDKSQWRQVADIRPERLFRDGSTLNPKTSPLYLLANQVGINILSEPDRAQRKIFWAVEDRSQDVKDRGLIATGHRARIAINYFDGQPHSLEMWIHREAEGDWQPAYFEFENGQPVLKHEFLGKPVEERCIQCHFNQGHPHEFPKTNPIPFAIWSGAYGDPELNGWGTKIPGVLKGLNSNYTVNNANRKDVLRYLGSLSRD